MKSKCVNSMYLKSPCHYTMFDFFNIQQKSVVRGKRYSRTTQDNKMALTAYLSANSTGLGREQTIPFDGTYINIGNAFDPILHVFICPVNGV